MCKKSKALLFLLIILSVFNFYRFYNHYLMKILKTILKIQYMQSFQNYLLLAKILNLLQMKYMINDMKYERILIIIKYSNLEPKLLSIWKLHKKNFKEYTLQITNVLILGDTWIHFLSNLKYEYFRSQKSKHSFDTINYNWFFFSYI